MTPLAEYIQRHTKRLDKPLPGPRVDMIFCWIAGIKDPATGEPKPETFRRLVLENAPSLLEGEHYLTGVTQQMGDEDLALRLMALGKMLDAWQVTTAKTLYKSAVDRGEARAKAREGFITIKPISR